MKHAVPRELDAGHLREARIPLKHVASLLGYSEPSALSRSCRRWFGASPREIRARSQRSTSAGRIGDNAPARAASAAERQEPRC